MLEKASPWQELNRWTEGGADEMGQLGPLVRVRAVEPLELYRVRLTFEDGTCKEVDLDPFLRGPIFESIRSDPQIFRAMKIIGSTIGWDNGADIDPDVLYYDLVPASLGAIQSAR